MIIDETNIWMIDFGLIIFFLWILLRSYHHGFLRPCVDVVFFVGSYFLARFLNPFLCLSFPLSKIHILNQWLWFFTVIFVVRIVYWLLIWSSILPSSHSHKHRLDQIIGLLFGFLKVGCIGILLVYILRIPLISNGEFLIQGTILSYFENILGGFYYA